MGSVQELVDDYNNYVGGGFAPYPVALTRVQAAKGWDVDEKENFDFLRMYSVANMRHGHPKQEGAVVNLPFHSPYYGLLANKLHELLGYDKFVAMTGGAEAADAAVKIARKWCYMAEKVPEGQCHILSAAACHYGATPSTKSLASKKTHLFGPFIPSVGSTSPSGKVVHFSVIEDSHQVLEADNDKITAFMIEPIQGLAGQAEGRNKIALRL